MAALWRRLQHYRFDWKLTLLLLLFLPLMLRLGVWQLAREQEKRELLALYEARQQDSPVNLDDLNISEDLQYRQVRLEGSPDAAHVFLLDNRVYQGRVGYEVLQPVVTAAGVSVFINRGWIAQGATRDELPMIPPLPQPVTLEGSVYMPVGDPVVLDQELMAPGWPKVIQVLDPAEMARVAALQGSVFPYTVRVAEGMPGALVRYWPVINLSPETHRGYAVQWFAMSLMLSFLYLYYSTKPEDAGSEP